MPRLTVVPFESGHAARIRLRAFDALAFGSVDIGMDMDMEVWGRFHQQAGPAITFLEDPGGEIVACAGIVIPWPGHGQGWALTSNLVARYPVAFCKAFLRHLRRFELQHGLERIQTHVHQDHLVSRRWLEWMGFSNEGLMRKYIGNHNHYLYARIH